jgi:hypothetical protein
MANIIICDFLKVQLKPGEPVYEVIVDGIPFEVGIAGRDALINHLAHHGMQPLPTIQHSPSQTSSGVEYTETLESFPEDESSDEVMEALPIPEDPNKSLPKPRSSMVQQVIKESTRFQEGSLPALTPRNSQNMAARDHLKKMEDAAMKRLSKGLHSGVTAKFDNNGR